MNKRGVIAAAAAVFLLSATAATAAVTAEFFDGTLEASSDAADAIAVTCAGGMAKVNGADPEGDPAPCGQVDSIEVTGGPGPNSIDLSGVTASAYSAAEYVAVSGDDGADTITGSAFRDELDGDADDDTLRGNAGNDALSGGEGSDRVFGAAGDDTISAALGNDALDGQAGSDTYQLDLFDLGPTARVADTGTEGTDAIELTDCEDVTVAAGQISREAVRVTVSGIETYPCGFVPPPAPPPPPAAKAGCIVPKVRGRTLTKARVLLRRAHCTVGKVTPVRSRLRKGIVLKQRPAPGRRRARGAKVSLRISRGP